MRFTLSHLLVVSTALATLLPSVIAAGQFIEIKNKCSRDIDVNVAYNGGRNGPPTILKANGGTRTFDIIEVGGSHKFRWHNGVHSEGELQFEHNVVKISKDKTQIGTWYDLSLVDAKDLGPFRKVNISVATSDENCPTVFCKANEICMKAYKHPEDHNTKYCSADTESVTLTFCPNGDDISAPARTPASGKIPAKTLAKAPAPVKAPTPIPAPPAHGPAPISVPAPQCPSKPNNCPPVQKICSCPYETHHAIHAS